MYGKNPCSGVFPILLKSTSPSGLLGWRLGCLCLLTRLGLFATAQGPFIVVFFLVLLVEKFFVPIKLFVSFDRFRLDSGGYDLRGVIYDGRDILVVNLADQVESIFFRLAQLVIVVGWLGHSSRRARVPVAICR